MRVGIHLGDLYPQRQAMPGTYPYDEMVIDVGARENHDKHLYAARAEKVENP